MSKYTLTGLVAEDVMIYGDNGKGMFVRIADCTPCDGEEKLNSYARAEKHAKRLVLCATHHDELVEILKNLASPVADRFHWEGRAQELFAKLKVK